MAKPDIEQRGSPQAFRVERPDKYEARAILASATRNPNKELTCIWRDPEGNITGTATRRPSMNVTGEINIEALLGAYDALRSADEVIIMERGNPDPTSS